MAVKTILLLGDPRLYETSEPVRHDELEEMEGVVRDLHDTLLAFRKKYKAGRAIAAPQIGVKKRLLYMFTGEPTVFINPRPEGFSREKMIVWDDCMCFPDLLVKVERSRSFRLRYKDLQWRDRQMTLEGDLSELLQHEYDHLDGILAVQRAVDERSFALRSQRGLLSR